MWAFFKNLFKKPSKQIDPNFETFVNNLIQYGNKEGNFYTFYLDKPQVISDEISKMIQQINPGFKNTNRIKIEFVGYHTEIELLSAFVYNSTADLYEFIDITPEILTALKWEWKITQPNNNENL